MGSVMVGIVRQCRDGCEKKSPKSDRDRVIHDFQSQKQAENMPRERQSPFPEAEKTQKQHAQSPWASTNLDQVISSVITQAIFHSWGVAPGCDGSRLWRYRLRSKPRLENAVPIHQVPTNRSISPKTANYRQFAKRNPTKPHPRCHPTKLRRCPSPLPSH